MGYSESVREQAADVADQVLTEGNEGSEGAAQSGQTGIIFVSFVIFCEKTSDLSIIVPYPSVLSV